MSRHSHPLRLRRVLFATALAALMTSRAGAFELAKASVDGSFWSATHLIEVKYDAEHAKWLNPTRESGFETSGGMPISFRPWYTATVRNASAAWMTQLTPSFGVIWGWGTGERGVKYVITPSVKLGLMAQHEVFKNGWLSLKATTILGGKLKEKSCLGNYDELGGVQEVNCRLAASTLAPEQTLAYLFREKPFNQHQLMLQFSQRF